MAGQNLMARRVASLLSEHIETFRRQCRAERLRIGDDVTSIFGTEGLELSQRHDLSSDVVQMVGGAGAGEYRTVEFLVKFLIILVFLYLLVRMRRRLGPFLSQMVPTTYLMIGGLMATFGALQGWEEALTFEVVVVTGLGLLIAVWGIDLWRKGSGR